MNAEVRLSVSGMSCTGCVASVENAINTVDGVSSASVNFAEHTATVEGEFSLDSLLGAISSAGFGATQLIGSEDEEEIDATEMAQYRNLLKMMQRNLG